MREREREENVLALCRHSGMRYSKGGDVENENGMLNGCEMCFFRWCWQVGNLQDVVMVG